MTNTNENLEKQIIGLIAIDRFHIVTSSLDGKLKRRKEKSANALELPKGRYNGERVYARTEFEDKMKARTMSEAVGDYCEKYPSQGVILTQMIEDKRASKETRIYFGVQSGRRLAAEDYLDVMANLGFTEAQARTLYEPLIGTSRALEKKRDEERSVMVD
jgi:hypothetical protein